jgi:1,2-phenylacetyl-CoA epoxidase catalytic subunit
VSDPAAESATGAATTAHIRYVLALADDALVASQRMGEWIASAPEL